MYVCNCNALNEKQVKSAVDAGATKWTDVHEFHGCAPQCGSCGPEISEIIYPAKKDSATDPASAILAAS